MAPWRPTVHVWPTLWNTKKNFHPNVQPVQFSSWYLPPFGFYGSLKKCHFSLPWEWFSLFPFSWGGGAPQTPSHIGSLDPLGVRNNQHQKKFFAPEPILKLSQSAPLKLRRDFSLAEGQIKRLFALCTSVICGWSSQFTTLIHYKTYTFVCVSTLLHCNKLRTSMTWRFTYFLWSFGVLNFAERHTPQIWHWLSGTPLRASGSIGSWSLCSPVNWDMAYSETSRCGHYLILTVCF